MILVGGFYADLFCTDKKQKVERSKFEVPEYDPMMYSITHPCTKNSLYMCRDFFTYKNPGSTTTITVNDVHAKTINPPPNLMTGPYTVNYDLFWDETKAIETLSATVTITPPPSTPISTSASTPISTSASTPIST